MRVFSDFDEMNIRAKLENARKDIAERVKIAVRSSSSRARIDSVSVGWDTNTRRAASLMLPHAATASAYFSC